MSDDELPHPRDMTQKELLIELNNQLAEIRRQNDQLIQILGDELEQDGFKCLSCGKVVAKSDRKEHQVRKHDVTADIDLAGEYRPL